MPVGLVGVYNGKISFPLGVVYKSTWRTREVVKRVGAVVGGIVHAWMVKRK